MKTDHTYNFFEVEWRFCFKIKFWGIFFILFCVASDLNENLAVNTFAIIFCFIANCDKSIVYVQIREYTKRRTLPLEIKRGTMNLRYRLAIPETSDWKPLKEEAEFSLLPDGGKNMSRFPVYWSHLNWSNEQHTPKRNKYTSQVNTKSNLHFIHLLGMNTWRYLTFCMGSTKKVNKLIEILVRDNRMY